MRGWLVMCRVFSLSLSNHLSRFLPLPSLLSHAHYSGKTYTMFGPNVDACDSGDDQRGLVPRVLEYLFAHVAREERRNGGAVTYLCRCSFYEIFNERVFDLLDSDSGCSLGGLQTREDMKKGVYVEGLTEEAVDSPHQAYQVLTRGYRNRHVGETAMNR